MTEERATRRGHEWPLSWAAAPLLALIVATLSLYVWGSPASHESPSMLFVANLAFTTVVSIFIAALAARSYLATGRTPLLAICVGMIVWGMSAFVSVIGEHVGNYNITIHNIGVAASGCCHLAGAYAARRYQGESTRSPGALLALGVAIGLILVGVIRTATLEGWLPPFVNGLSATPLRTFVLVVSIAIFAVAAALTTSAYRATGWRFLHWYALGLAAIAVGAVGLLLQPTYGSWLGWVARSTQYLGGFYMLTGTVLTMHETGKWVFSLEDRLLRTQQTVRNQAELIRHVNDNTNELIFMKDRAGRLTYANAATIRVLGGPQFAPGTQDSEFFDVAAEHAAISDNDRRVMETGQVVEAEEVFTGADGRRRIYAATKSPLRNDAGEITGVIGVSRDITERKLQEEMLREREQRFRNLADDAPVFIWMCDENLDNTYTNRTLLDQIGARDVSEFGGRKFEAFYHPDDVAGSRTTFLDAVLAHRPFTMENRLRRASDGEYRWTFWHGVPRFDAGRFSGFMGVGIDVHDRKLATDALRDADRRKDEFLATLAHELRSPLSPMRTGLAILNLPEVDRGTFKDATAMMNRQLEQLVRLIDDLLDVSRVSRGKLELRKDRVEIGAVIRQALETTKPLFDDAGHEVSLLLPPQPVYLLADPVRLAQIVGNLLNNACKFTRNRGRVTVAVECHGNDAVITVKDTGIGIAPKDISRIFALFSQLDTTLEKSQGGLGIGLALVKRLVEMHGGTIEVRSEGRDCGSEFVVRLPVVVDAAPLPREEPVALPKQGGRRILVVDDNHDSAESLAMLLALTGNETHTAHDGEQAVEAATQLRPDLIVLDISMPKLNGYDACRLIRAQPGGESIVIVATTGLGQDDDKRRSSEAGFDGHLVKPVDPAALMDLVRRAGA